MIIVFAAVMCLIAMLAIAVDWMGKPIRNRKFVPRIYRYADESELRVQSVPAGTFPAMAPQHAALPAAGQTGIGALPAPAEFAPPGGALLPHDAAFAPAPPLIPLLPVAERPDVAAHGQSTSFAELVALETFPSSSPELGTSISTLPVSPEELLQTDSLDTFAAVVDPDEGRETKPLAFDPGQVTSEPGVWQPGEPIWSPTADGATPNKSVATRRFWQATLVGSPASAWLGEANIERMRAGDAPRRFNHLTSTMETMEITDLNAPASSFNTDAKAGLEASDAYPRWPGEEIDPFSS